MNINNNSNIVLDIPFNGKDGATIAKDYSKYNHRLIFNGNVEISKDEFYNPDVQSVCFFPGSAGDYVSISDNDSFDIKLQHTIKCRVRFDTISSNQFLVQQRQDSSNTWELYWSSGNGITFVYEVGGASLINFSQGNTDGWAVDTWYDIALVRKDNIWTIYRNGVIVARTVDSSSLTPLSSPLYIGANEGSSLFLNGYIQNVMIIQNEAQDDYAYNNSRSGHEVTAEGDAHITTSIEDPFGGNDGVGTFDGTGDYLSLLDSVGWYLDADLTIAGWVKVGVTGTAQTIVGQRDSADDQWDLQIEGTNGHLFSRVEDGGVAQDLEGTTDLTDNQWHHVAMIQSGTTRTLYVDGISEDNDTFSGWPNLGSALYVGNKPDKTNYFTGQMSDLHISKGIARHTENFVIPDTREIADEYTALLLPMTLEGWSVAENTVLQLKCNDNSANTTVTDEEGTNGTSSTNTSNLHITGKVGTGAFDFTASSSEYVNCNQTLSSTFQSAFNVSGWVMPNDGQPASQQYIFGSANGGVADAVYAYINTDGKLYIGYASDGNSVSASTSSAIFINGQETWKHLSINFSATEITLYLNGVSEALTSGSMAGVTMGDFSNAYDMYIGCQNSAGTPATFLDGAVDDFRIYDRVLTQTEISKTYNKGVGTDAQGSKPLTYFPDSGVKMQADLNGDMQPASIDPATLQGRILDLNADNTKGRHYITANGDAKVKTGKEITAVADAKITRMFYDPFGVLGGVGTFDGTGDELEVADSNDFYFDGAFTVKARVKTSYSATQYIVGQRDDADNMWYLYITSSGLVSTRRETGGSIKELTGTTDIADGNWHDIEWVQESGGFQRLFIDGTQEDADSIGSMPNLTSVLKVGNIPQKTDYFNGQMSDLHISKGIARHISNFIPSTIREAPDQYTALLLPMDGVQDSTQFYDKSFTDPFGNYDGFYEGDGTVDCLSLPDSADWNLGTSCSIQGWIWVDDTASYTLLAQETDSNNRVQLATIATSNYLEFAVKSGGSWSSRIGTIAIPTGEWVHIYLGISATNVYLGVNGVVENFSTLSFPNLTSILYIGSAYSGTYSLNGYLSYWMIDKGVTRHTTTFTKPTAPPVQDEYTVLYLPMTGKGGDTRFLDETPISDTDPMAIWRDQSEYGNDAEETTEAYKPLLKKSSVNSHNALWFDGSNDMLTCPDVPEWDFGGRFSIVFIFNCNLDYNDPIISRGNYGANPLWYIRKTSDSKLNFYMYTGSSGVGLTSPEGSALTDKWCVGVITCTPTGSNYRYDMYVDGVLADTVTSSVSAVADNQPVEIGYFSSSTDRWFSGHLGRIMIFNRPLNIKEVSGVSQYLKDYYYGTKHETYKQYHLASYPLNDPIASGAKDLIGNTDLSRWEGTVSPNLNFRGDACNRCAVVDRMFGELTTNVPVFTQPGLDGFVISIWGYPTSLQDGSAWNKYNGVVCSNDHSNFCIRCWNAGTSYFIQDLTNSYVYGASGPAPNLNEWNHFVFIASGGYLVAYQNGIRTGEPVAYDSINDDTGTYFFLGRDVVSQITGWAGDLAYFDWYRNIPLHTEVQRQSFVNTLFNKNRANIIELSQKRKPLIGEEVLDKYRDKWTLGANLDEKDGPRHDLIGGNTLDSINTVGVYNDPEFGDVADFNGTDQYLRIADSVDISPTTDMVISCWVYQEATSAGGQTILRKADAYEVVYANATNELFFRIYESGATARRLDSGVSITEDTWVHVVAIADSIAGRIYLYKDGAEIGTPVVYDGTIKDNTSALYFAQNAIGSEWWTGRMCKIKNYRNQQFESDTERETFVSKLYNGGTPRQIEPCTFVPAKNHQQRFFEPELDSLNKYCVGGWKGDSRYDAVGHNNITSLGNATIEEGLNGRKAFTWATASGLYVPSLVGKYVDSLAFWFKSPTVIDKTSSLFRIQFKTSNPYAIFMKWGSTTGMWDDEVITILEDNPTSNRTTIRDITISANEWHFYCLVWNVATTKYEMYLDGIKQIVSTNTTYGVQRILCDATYYMLSSFVGQASDVLLLEGHSLTQREITLLYKQGLGEALAYDSDIQRTNPAEHIIDVFPLGEANGDRYSAKNRYKAIDTNTVGSVGGHNKSYCANFVGANIEYLLIDNDTLAISNLIATNMWSLGIWYKSTATDSKYIYGCLDLSSKGMLLGFNGATNILYVQLDVTNEINIDYDLNDGEWHRIWVTLSNPILKVYVDNVLVGTKDDVADLTDSTNSFALGARWFNGFPQANMTGQLQDFTVVDIPLDTKFIEEDYNDGDGRFYNKVRNLEWTENPVTLDDITANIIASWNMDDCNDKYKVDNVSNFLLTSDGAVEGVEDSLFKMVTECDGGNSNLRNALASVESALKPANLTFAIWLKHDSYSDAYTTAGSFGLGLPSGTEANWAYRIRFHNTNVYFDVIDDSDIQRGNNVARPTNTNWHLYVLTYDGSNVRTYIDNALVGTVNAMTGAINPTYSGDFLLGGESGEYAYEGKIGPMFVLNTAITLAQVQALYNTAMGSRLLKVIK